MNYFLRPEIRNDLIEALVGDGMPMDAAKRMAELPDDMVEVDLRMTCHVAAVAHFRELNREEEAMKGMAIISSIMHEAMQRGLSETDFPMSLEAMKQTLVKVQ